MSTDVPPTIEAVAPATDPAELLCPHCDYNLVGSETGVCPECGQPFDRNRLILWTTAAGTVIPCPDLDGTYVDLSPFIMSVLKPTRLGRHLSPRPNVRRTFGWSMALRSLSVLPASLATISVAGTDAAPGMFIALPAIVIGSLFTEEVIAALLAMLVRPLAVPRGKTWSFWRGLCGCFSTHLVISSCWLGFLTLAATVIRQGPDPLSSLLAAVVPPILLWWCCLSRAIYRRGLPSIGRAVVQVCIPFVGLLGLILGLMAGGLIGGVFSSLFLH